VGPQVLASNYGNCGIRGNYGNPMIVKLPIYQITQVGYTVRCNEKTSPRPTHIRPVILRGRSSAPKNPYRHDALSAHPLQLRSTRQRPEIVGSQVLFSNYGNFGICGNYGNLMIVKLPIYQITQFVLSPPSVPLLVVL